MTRRKHEIYTVLDKLWAENGGNKIPTGKEITERLDREGYLRGSPNQLYQYRDAWIKERGISQEALEQGEAESSDQALIKAATEASYAVIRKKANEEIAKIKEELEPQIHSLTEQLQTITQQYDELRQQHTQQTQALADSQKACQLTTELLDQTKKENHTLKAVLEATQKEANGWRDQVLSAHNALQQSINEELDKLAQDQKTVTENYAQELSSTRTLMESSRHDFIVEITNFKVAQEKWSQQVTELREEKQQAVTQVTALQKENQEKMELIHTLQQQNQHLLTQIQELTQTIHAWNATLQTEQSARNHEQIASKEEITQLIKELPDRLRPLLQQRQA